MLHLKVWTVLWMKALRILGCQTTRLCWAPQLLADMAKHLFHLIVQSRFLLPIDSPLKEVVPALIERDRGKIPGPSALAARWRGWTLSSSWGRQADRQKSSRTHEQRTVNREGFSRMPPRDVEVVVFLYILALAVFFFFIIPATT